MSPLEPRPIKRYSENRMLDPVKHWKVAPNRTHRMNTHKTQRLAKSTAKKQKNSAGEESLALGKERVASCGGRAVRRGPSGKRCANREIGVPGRGALRYSWRRATMGSTLMAFRVGM